MKKTQFIAITLLVMAGTLMAGGIVTNANQSAAYVRTLNRNASTQIDAAYYNPAGLTMLEDGIHLGISNQSIFQTRDVTNSTATLHSDAFEGTVSAPVYPNLYVAYKTGALVFSGGFTIIGGGGSATFEKGLPMFEVPVSALKLGGTAGLADYGVTDYKVDIEFDGSSVYYGIQGGAAYKINDMISVAVGARMISASNSYVGFLHGVEVDAAGTWMIPGNVMRGVAAGATAMAVLYADTAATYQTLADAETDPTLKAVYQSAADQYTAGATQYTIGAATAAGTATYLDGATADVDVDATQSGTALAVIVGANISPMEGLNIGVRFETMAALELENSNDDANAVYYPDGDKVNADMPAMLAVGVAYDATPELTVMGSFNYYMNTGVNWDGSEDDIENGFEAGVAVEYALSDALSASVGFLTTTSGATDDYQTDLSHSLDANTIGFGVGYRINPNMLLNIGLLNAFYGEGQNSAGIETYNRSSLDVAIGLQIAL